MVHRAGGGGRPGADPAEVAFYEGLARVRGAATALLREEGTGRVLVVDPTYKPWWAMPGGAVEEGESPLAACRRECAEELGLVPRLRGLVAVDWVPGGVFPNGRPALVHVFAGPLSAEEAAGLRPDGVELSAARLVGPEELEGLLPERLARRIGWAVRADDAGSVVYLEDGRPVDWQA
ncbi:NUDIX domain-containing protein [Nocardiopsis potens]|uniref:NUDIX domain-containing protein n=1 Tax=Nocardiopsis potens TaxID=1246458 RepID=UPI000594C6EE|nr:NUDIX hydrolase [Nocardiopsis potens]